MIVEEIAESVAETTDTAKDLAELHIAKTKLDMAEGLSKMTVGAVSLLIRLAIIFNAAFFIAMGLALLIGHLLGIDYAGFFIIGAFFTALLAVFAAIRKRCVESKIVRMYVEMFFKD